MKPREEIVAERKAARKPRTLSPVWTKAEEARLADMWSREVDKAEICKRLGRTPAAIEHRASTLGLKKPVHHTVVLEKRAAMPAGATFEDAPEAVTEFNRPLSRADSRIVWRAA